MSRAGRLWYKVRMRIADLATQYEYARASYSLHDDVAKPLPDTDEGIHIRGPLESGMEEPDEVPHDPIGRRSTFGRRTTDLNTDHIITKKLVVVTVVLVNALFIAGDALLSGQSICP
jgi:hypothetical protein